MDGIKKNIFGQLVPLILLITLLAIVKVNADTTGPEQKAIITLQNGEQFFLQASTSKNSLPKLNVKNVKQGAEKVVIFGESALDVFSNQIQPLLYFKQYSIKGLPNPIIVAVAAAPGGSDTLFITKIISFGDGQVLVLNNPEWKTLIEGGVFLGKLPNNEGYGAIVWNFILGEGESHIDNHRYEADIYRWNGKVFKCIQILKTKNKYNNAATALNEFYIKAQDIVSTDFSVYDHYR